MRKRLQSTLLVIVLALVMIMTAGLAACAQDDTPPEPEKYTVTVENGTGGGKFDEGTEITVTATVPEGKEFESWQSDGTVVSTANPYTFTVRKDITLTATFKDAAVTPPDPGPEGPDPDKELEDLEDEVWYTVVADGGRIDGADVSSKQVKSGTEVQITAVIPEFYDFECWNKDGEKFTEEQTFTYEVTANVKFTSVISAVSRYKLTAEGCTYESIYQAGTEVVTVRANERENYEFVNWTINGETVNEPEIYTFELTEDTTVVANFRRINIEVNAVSDDEIIKVNLTSDDADPDTGLFVEGDRVTVEAELYNGIELNGWRDEEGELLSRDNPYTFTVTDDITVTADIGDHYTVTVVGGTLVGTDNLTTAEYGMNANCNVQANVGENEIFLNWTDEGGVVLSTANPYVFKVNDDITVTANVEEVAPGITYVFEAENADLTKLISQNGDNRCVESHVNDDHNDPVLNEVNKCSNGWIAACFNHNIGNTITWNIRSDRAAEAVLETVYRNVACARLCRAAFNQYRTVVELLTVHEEVNVFRAKRYVVADRIAEPRKVLASKAGIKLVNTYVLKESRKNLVKGLYVFRFNDPCNERRITDNYITIANNDKGYYVYNEFDKDGIVVKPYGTNQYNIVKKNKSLQLHAGDEIYFELDINKAIGIECGGKNYSFIRMARFMEEKR